MQTLILFAVFFGTAFVVLSIYAFVNRRRLAAVAALRSRASGGTVASDVSILRDLRKSAVPFLDRALTGQALTVLIERAIARAGVRWSVGEFVIASTLIASIFLLAGQRFGVLVAVLIAAIGLLMPAMLLVFLRGRRMKRFETQLPDAIDMIVNAMRAGFSFQAAMKFVGEEMPAPLGEEFMKFYDEQRLGLDVRSALLDLQERVGSLDIKMFVTSLLIQRETGGNLSEILTSLSTLVRDRGALYAQIDTLTAEPKLTGAVLAALPVLAFVALMMLNPSMMQPLFTTETGHYILYYTVGSVIFGSLLIRHIARIDV
jgi:tight adherence protein B